MITIFELPNLVAGFSTRQQGNMRIKPSGDAALDNNAAANRRKFLESLDLSGFDVIQIESEHRANVATIADEHQTQTLKDTDALITRVSGVALCVTIADCLALYFYEPQTKTIALAHAGWRGLTAGVIEKVVEEITQKENRSGILVGIGPAIGGCHYEVGPEVAEKFAKYPHALRTEPDGKTFLDIKTVAEQKLIDLGVPKENIHTSPDCTYEFPGKYFSFRRDKPEIIETMLAVLALRP